jgi:hypothetical protein
VDVCGRFQLRACRRDCGVLRHRRQLGQGAHQPVLAQGPSVVTKTLVASAGMMKGVGGVGSGFTGAPVSVLLITVPTGEAVQLTALLAQTLSLLHDGKLGSLQHGAEPRGLPARTVSWLPGQPLTAGLGALWLVVA